MIDDQQLVNTLLEQGFLDQASLKECLEKTEKTGRSLYETLIFDERMSESDLVRLVSEVLNVPTADVNPPAISEDVRTLVPGSMARRNRVVPLAMNDGELVLGMADPIDVLAMDEIATHTGVDIRPVLVGPATLNGALSEIYPDRDSSDLGDDIMSSFEDFDVQGMMDEVMAGDEWSDLFEKEDEEPRPSVEDSAVLSREMRDRPSTDVLAEEDLPDSAELEELEEELPEIEIIEELGKPVEKSKVPDPYADLDRWEVDEAITGNLSPSAGDSEILSAASAHELFSSGAETPARLDRPHTRPSEAEEDEEVDEVEEIEDEAEVDEVALPPKEAEPVEEPEVDGAEELSEVSEPASKTSVGVGVRELDDITSDAKTGPETDALEATGRTALGVGPMLGGDSADDDSDEPSAEEADDETDEATDYGALGRAILKTKPTTEASDATDDEGPEPSSDAVEDLDNGETNVAGPNSTESKRPTQPEPATAQMERRAKVRAAATTDSSPQPPEELEEPPAAETDIIQPIVEEDEEAPEDPGPNDQGTAAEMALELTEEGKDRETQEDALLPEEIKRLEDEEARGRENSPTPRLPSGIDVEGLALALANLLISKEILTLDEVFQLAKSLSETEDD